MTQKVVLGQPYLATVLAGHAATFKTATIPNLAYPQPSNAFQSGQATVPSVYSTIDVVLEFLAVSGSSQAMDCQLYGSNDGTNWEAIGSAAVDNNSVSTVILSNTNVDYLFLQVWSVADATTTPSVTLNITVYGSVQKVLVGQDNARALSVASSTIKSAIFRNVAYPQPANQFESGAATVPSAYSSIDVLIECLAVAGSSAAFTAQLYGCNDGLAASMSAIGSATSSINATGATLLANTGVEFEFLQIWYVMSATTTPTATTNAAILGF